MSALTIIHKQLCEILHLMKEDLIHEEYVNNYFICEDDCKLLPKQDLQEYLITTKVENPTFLLIVNKLCVEIIDIWNNGFKTLKLREFKETFHSERIKFATTFFRAIHLTEEKWHYCNSIEAKKYFADNKNYTTYQISDISARCGTILNWITATYPDTGKDIIEKYNFQQYLKTGIFHFQPITESLYPTEFEYVSCAIYNFEKSYYYILGNLPESKKIAFKHETLVHLKEVLCCQEKPEFITLINGTILRLDKDIPDQQLNFETNNLIDNRETILKLENKLIPSQETLQIPYNFFKNLTIEKNSNGQIFIEEYVLLNFLKDAFHLRNKTPKYKINKGNREQMRITYFFYEFMLFSQSNDYENSSQNNTKYLEILTNYFIGFSFNAIKRNFSNKPAKPILTIKKT